MIEAPIQLRSCNGCNECCKGWVEVQVFDDHVDQDHPCKFIENSQCGTYNTRPISCQRYFCAWSYDIHVPFWMKPDKIKALLTTHKVGNLIILEIRECGQKLLPEVSQWALDMFNKKKIANIKMQIDNEWFYYSHHTSDLENYIRLNLP